MSMRRAYIVFVVILLLMGCGDACAQDCSLCAQQMSACMTASQSYPSYSSCISACQFNYDPGMYVCVLAGFPYIECVSAGITFNNPLSTSFVIPPDCWGLYQSQISCYYTQENCASYCHNSVQENCEAIYQNCSSCGGSGGGGGGGVVVIAGDDSTNMGETKDEEGCVARPVNLSNGNMYFSHSDYMTDGLARELSFVRTYNSRSEYNGLFGVGWSTSFEKTLQIDEDDVITVSSADGNKVSFSRASSATNVYVAYLPQDDRSNIIANTEGTFTHKLKSGENYIYGSDGKLVSIIDRNGNITSLSYQNSRLDRITSPTGRYLSISYNVSGKVSSVSDGYDGSLDQSYDPSILGKIADYYYDSPSGSLSKVVYPDGSEYEYIYEYNSGTSKYYLSAVKDIDDNILESHLYDNQGRAVTSEIGAISTQIDSEGIEKYRIEYTSDSVTTVRDALNRVTQVTFDKTKGKNVVTSVTGPYCQQSQTTKTKQYDSYLNLKSETDQLGYTTAYDYDYDGNVKTVTTASNSPWLKSRI